MHRKYICFLKWTQSSFPHSFGYQGVGEAGSGAIYICQLTISVSSNICFPSAPCCLDIGGGLCCRLMLWSGPWTGAYGGVCCWSTVAFQGGSPAIRL